MYGLQNMINPQSKPTNTPPNPKDPDYGMAPPIAIVATCTLNQWALDFKENKRRILESIKVAKSLGCKYRIGPELEICGYDCEDHFYELDTTKFSWKALAEIIVDPICSDILCDVGMPVLHNGVRYNCRVYFLNKKLLLIRPKMWMADDGNYREERWFTPWSKDKIPILEDYILSEQMKSITGQQTVKFGVGIVETVDATIASEVCEELFTPESPNILWGLEGVDIISNGSASHWQMGKRLRRHALIKEATRKNGGAYLYSNMVGCDGNRLVFDGNSMIYKNGELLATGDHLTFGEVEVVTAKVNLDDVRSYRSAIVSRGIQADRRDVTAPRIMVEDYVPGFRLTDSSSRSYDETKSIEVPLINQYEEMGLGISRYMWDYLVRSTAGGFFLPLSGGVDSGSTSLFVYFMCNKLVEIVKGNDPSSADPNLKAHVAKRLNDFILGNGKRPGYQQYVDNNFAALDTKRLMNILLHTCNMPTKNNTPEIRKQASDLAKGLGSYHLTTPINDAFIAAKNMVKDVQFGVGITEDEVKAEKKADYQMMEIPRYKSSGGDWQENLAIQNIQARLRMVTAYYMAQTLILHRWDQEYAGITQEAWKAYYDDKKAAIQKAQAASPETLEERLDFVPYLSAASKTLHLRIIKDRGGSPFLLVLASSNSDEALRGFFTKYDAGSADLNPIGSFSKTELRAFMRWIMTDKFHGNLQNVTEEAIAAKKVKIAEEWASRRIDTTTIQEKVNEEAILQVIIATSAFEPVNRILNVTASPELTPTAGGAVQDDEYEITMTYSDLYELGKLRKSDNLGPYSMFLRLCKDRLWKPMKFVNYTDWRKLNPYEFDGLKNIIATPTVLAKLIERFFDWYNKNRSKMTILTPGIHATSYSPDDNRYDQRPYLLPYFPASDQMAVVNAVAAKMEKDHADEMRSALDTTNKMLGASAARQGGAISVLAALRALPSKRYALTKRKFRLANNTTRSRKD
jgi:NAD+ synthase (glutamine-hydrolysing)